MMFLAARAAAGQGAVGPAERWARRLCQLHPDSATPWLLWGRLRLAAGDSRPLRLARLIAPADAEAARTQAALTRRPADWARAALLEPRHIDAWTGWVQALAARRAWAALVAVATTALAASGGLALCREAAEALRQAGLVPPGLHLLQRATLAAPDQPGPWLDLCRLTRDTGARSRAATAAARAVFCSPDSVAALGALATLRAEQGQYAEALDLSRRTVRAAPGDAGAHFDLATWRLQTGAATAALRGFRAARLIDPTDGPRHGNMLMAQCYDDRRTPAARRRETALWGLLHGRGLAAQAAHFPNPPDPDRRLRVGLLAANLHAHPETIFTRAPLAHRNPRHWHLAVFHTGHRIDAATRTYQALADDWHALAGRPDRAVAEAIRAAGIDVLIDLTWHSSGSRMGVLARRPAPVQLAWMGLLGGTGLDTVDGLIVDPVLAPTDDVAEEPLYRLPHAYLCYAPPDGAPPVAPLPARETGRVTFGSFNNLAKLSDTTVALWARVLAAVPDSRLMLKYGPLGDLAIQAETRARFAAHGIGGDRLILEGASPYPVMLDRYGAVDIGLDPWPFPGGTTTCEALHMGVPVVHLPGPPLAGRIGTSFLGAAGLGDWIAGDADAYVALAAGWAGRLDALAALRRGLRAQLAASPLCDAPAFMTALDEVVRAAWRHWCRQAESTVR